ncbi:MAG TPA: hypothetical protein VHT94_01670 [Streptosporangiaceae bacterium]|nr:hypothetical protein [Streptosporangiaceae bacterium]
MRLAPREELAAAARVAPLLRAARDVARWIGPGRTLTKAGRLRRSDAVAAATHLELIPAEFDAAWRVAVAAGMLVLGTGQHGPDQHGPDQQGDARVHAGDRLDVLASGTADDVLAVWDAALTAMLEAEDLDGMATALYTVGGPVRMDSLFDAYLAAADTRRRGARGAEPGPEGELPPDRGVLQDESAALSVALEMLADLGVVELGADEPGVDEDGGALTVTLSPLGVWGVHRRLRAQGWHVPVVGGGSRGDATALLATLANCDVEDGEAEIASWLGGRTPRHAAVELISAASQGSPGLRGAGFAVLDRIGEDAVAAVREALADPVLRAHAAVWLHEHGEDAELDREDRAWLLVDLGAGLLEEADPQDVVAELLPDVPPDAQAELVAGLWRVRHPGVTDLLTALSDHHPDPGVSRAARKAAFKARSVSAGSGSGSS